MADWKVTILSYNLFPTVPLTFDEMYWEAYWPIVNEPVLDVRKVMMTLEKERKEKEMEKIKENKQKLEREEADRLDAQKKQEELRLRKRKKFIESPTQSPLSEPPESPFSQDEESPPPKRKSSPPKRRMIESPSPPTSLVPRPVRFFSLLVMLFRE